MEKTTCPNCGSENIVQGLNGLYRCLDCGWRETEETVKEEEEDRENWEEEDDRMTEEEEWFEEEGE